MRACDIYLPTHYWAGYDIRQLQDGMNKWSWRRWNDKKNIDVNNSPFLTEGKYKLSYLCKASTPGKKKDFTNKVRWWARKAGDKNDPQIDTWDNLPSKGFFIMGTSRRYETQNAWFQVMHPKGFVFEISVENLLHIIQRSSICWSQIADECILGFDGSVRLLVVGSEEHEAALNYTNMKDHPMSLNSLEKGSKVKFKYQRTDYDGHYLGRYYAYSVKNNENFTMELQGRTLRHFFVMKDYKGDYRLVAIAKPNLLSVGEVDENKAKWSLKKINQLNSRDCCYVTYDRFFHIDDKIIKDFYFDTIPTIVNDLHEGNRTFVYKGKHLVNYSNGYYHNDYKALVSKTIFQRIKSNYYYGSAYYHEGYSRISKPACSEVQTLVIRWGEDNMVFV